MELQWPLILFTTLLAWAAGVFGAQCLYALRGQGTRAQMPALITSAALLVVGGIAVFFHLEHWERIFNGFGHLTSGITQELIAIVALAVVAVIYLVFLRKSGDGTVPRWIAVAALVFSAILVVVCGHSYMMAARPAWDSVLQIGSLVGAALILGPLTLGVIMACAGDDLAPLRLVALVGTVVGTVLIAVYAVVMQMAGESFIGMGHYFDPTHPTAPVVDTAALFGSQIGLIWGGGVGLGGLVPAACAFMATRKGDSVAWKLWGSAGVACAVIGAVTLRAAFYSLGLSVFMFF